MKELQITEEEMEIKEIEELHKKFHLYLCKIEFDQIEEQEIRAKIKSRFFIEDQSSDEDLTN